MAKKYGYDRYNEHQDRCFSAINLQSGYCIYYLIDEAIGLGKTRIL